MEAGSGAAPAARRASILECMCDSPGIPSAAVCWWLAEFVRRWEGPVPPALHRALLFGRQQDGGEGRWGSPPGITAPLWGCQSVKLHRKTFKKACQST